MNTFYVILLFLIPASLLAPNDSFQCKACHSIIGTIHDIFASQSSIFLLANSNLVIDILKPPFKWACSKAKPQEYCNNLFDTFLPVVNEVAHIFNESTICGYYNFCAYPRILIDSDLGFAKRILRNTPPRTYSKPKNTSTPLKILVVTDTHIDFDYIEVF